nr:transposase (putative), gypsy type [Tanacetum cinerariifolium]
MSDSEIGEMVSESSRDVVPAKFDMHIYTSELTPEELEEAIKEYGISLDLHPQFPPSDLTMDKLPSAFIGIYVEQIEQGGLRIPLSTFFLAVIRHFGVHVSQLILIGVHKFIMFEICCRSLTVNVFVPMFHVFYKLCKHGHWFSFENKVGGRARKCFKEVTSSLNGWKKKFFLIDRRAVPEAMPWRHTDSDMRDDFPTNYRERDAARLSAVIVPLRLPPRHLLYMCGLTTLCRHPKLSYNIKTQKGEENLEKSDLKVVAVREKSEQKACQAQANHGGGGLDGVEKKKRARKDPEPQGSRSVGTHPSATPLHSIAPAAAVDTTNVENVDVTFANVIDGALTSVGPLSDSAVRSPLDGSTRRDKKATNLFDVHPSLSADGGGSEADGSEFRFVPDWGLREYLRIFTIGLVRSSSLILLLLLRMNSSEAYLTLMLFVGLMSLEVGRIKGLEASSEAQGKLLAIAEERVRFLEGENVKLAAGMAKEEMSIAVPVSLSFTASWLCGLSLGRTPDQIEELIAQSDNLDIEGSKTWKAKHRELFTKSYSFIQKVSDSYRLPFESLMKLIPDASSSASVDRTTTPMETPAPDGASDHAVVEGSAHRMLGSSSTHLTLSLPSLAFNPCISDLLAFSASAGRLLGAYNLRVATPRALVYAGDKTSVDARSAKEAPSVAEELHPLCFRVPLMSKEFEASDPSAKAAASSLSSFRKRYRSSYETLSPSSSLTFPIRKRYQGTSELILDTETEDESSNSDAEGQGSEDEGPSLDDEAVLVVNTTVDEPLCLGYGALRCHVLELGEGSVSNPEDGRVYTDILTYPPVAPVQTPPSPEWSSGSFLVSPSSLVVPSPIASPVTTPATTISVDEDQFLKVWTQLELHGSILHDHTQRLDALPSNLFEGYDKDLRELYTRSGVVRDEIFSQRYRFRSLEREQERDTMTFRAILALEAWTDLHFDAFREVFLRSAKIVTHDESLPHSPIYDRYQSGNGYHTVPPPYTGTFMPPKPDLVFNNAPNAVETDYPAFNVQLSPIKPDQDLSHTNRPSAPIIEDWVSDSEDESETKTPQNVLSFVQSTEQVKYPRTLVHHVETFIPAATPNSASPNPASNDKRRNRKACFVCKSLDHLIKDCNYHEIKMAQPTARNHAHRGNHKKCAPMTHPNPQRHMVPATVPTQSKPVPITAVRPVSTAVPKIKVTRPRHAKPIITKPISPTRMLINRSPSPKSNNSPSRVTDVLAPMVNVAQGIQEKWEWKTKCPILDHGNPQHALKDKGVIDSGCSRHMTGNMFYLSDFEELNGGYVTFGGNPKGGKISGKGKIRTGKLDFNDVYFVNELKFNLFSVSQMCDKKNGALFTYTECLVLSPDFKLPDESQVMLRVPRENNMYNDGTY